MPLAKAFIAWELTDEAQLEGLAKNNILPSRPALADNKYFAADPRVVTTAKALGVGYVPWVYHFADMVNSDSSPWINMLQRAIFDGDVDGAINEGAREDEGDRRRVRPPRALRCGACDRRDQLGNGRAGSTWRRPCCSSPCSCSIPLGQLVAMSLTDRSLLGGGTVHRLSRNYISDLARLRASGARWCSRSNTRSSSRRS